ncbi:MAG: CRISPR-associated helicase Cas3' [Opitutaceae bacterium]|jgi:CRISPR-associated endonuclease/helicase Cas3
MVDAQTPPSLPRRYYAHTAEDEQGNRLPESSGQWQPLAEHLQNVAKLAAAFAKPFGAEPEAHLAGLLHDLGKYRDEFQSYLRGERSSSAETQHAIYGGAILHSKSESLANLIAGHHAGLFDWAAIEPKLRALRAEQHEVLQTCLRRFQSDVSSLPPSFTPSPVSSTEQSELRTRLLLSALVDADRLDTESHSATQSGRPAIRQPHPPLTELRDRLHAHLANFPAPASPESLAGYRTRITARCAAAATEYPPGVFSLTVPTGGAKTLASAQFALDHAIKNGFERIIYVIPFTSILEQNADVFRKAFGPDTVLEHHSLAEWQKADDEESGLAARRSRLAAENWDHPFILTTNVQFFESLHNHRPSACRKLHRFTNAVVIFDECQTFPPELLDPSLRRLRALVEIGRTSLVFCTATQPAFLRGNAFPEGFETVTEIIPHDWQLHNQPPFARTRYERLPQPLSLEQLVATLAPKHQALTIVNTRRAAWELFHRLRNEGVYHLSTLMCPAHRLDVLDGVRQRLRTGQRCLVISTQLIEAGVDVDFPEVWRESAPLDAIIQAAGRCNREGRLLDADQQPRLGAVFVFTLDGMTSPPGTYRRGIEIARGLMPKELAANLPPDLISTYFAALYQTTTRDRENIAQLSRDLSYRQIGERYRWIDSDTCQVLTDWGETGRALHAEVQENEYAPPSRAFFRRAARYCVNLRTRDVERAANFSPKIRRLHNGLYLTQGSYDSECGYLHFNEPPPELFSI